VSLDELIKAGSTEAVPVEDLIALEAALTRLEAVDARAAEVVVLRFYAGLSVMEVADHLGLSTRRVEQDWSYARAWLRRELSGQGKT
jgi:RNA polymerase sigma factor (sigma-70 family)